MSPHFFRKTEGQAALVTSFSPAPEFSSRLPHAAWAFRLESASNFVPGQPTHGISDKNNFDGDERDTRSACTATELVPWLPPGTRRLRLAILDRPWRGCSHLAFSTTLLGNSFPKCLATNKIALQPASVAQVWNWRKSCVRQHKSRASMHTCCNPQRELTKDKLVCAFR